MDDDITVFWGGQTIFSPLSLIVAAAHSVFTYYLLIFPNKCTASFLSSISLHFVKYILFDPVCALLCAADKDKEQRWSNKSRCRVKKRKRFSDSFAAAEYK